MMIVIKVVTFTIGVCLGNLFNSEISGCKQKMPNKPNGQLVYKITSSEYGPKKKTINTFIALTASFIKQIKNIFRFFERVLFLKT